MMISVIIIALIGLAISVYGITIEHKLQQDAQYKPACDISDTISCSRPFFSPYGKMFGISNSKISALYYCLIIIAIMNMNSTALLVTSAGVAVSVVFAYILYFKIRSLCLICTSLYIINITLVLTCYFA